MPGPPAQFLAMQVSRLKEALLVSWGAMSGAQPSGGRSRRQDRARARSLSRFCRGRAPGPSERPEAPEHPRAHGAHRRADLQSTLDELESPRSSRRCSPARIRPQMAPQRLEKIKLAPRKWYGPGSTGPPTSGTRARRRFHVCARPGCPNSSPVEAPPNSPEMAPQTVEKIESRARNGMVSEALDPQDGMGLGRGLQTPKIWRRREASHSSTQPPQTRAEFYA